MKITSVGADHRKRALEVTTPKGTFEPPYAKVGLSRREVLGLLGATAAASLVGVNANCAPQDDASTPPPACVVRPEQTEGPYFLDERLERSDIRTDADDRTGRSLVLGVPLSLLFGVSRVDGAACRPLPSAVVDLWQCDGLGVYSGFRDRNGNFDTRDRTFLRGYQVTDAGGRARFTTIYPGWYPGRTVHIHFKVRTPGDGLRAHEHTSQLYFDDELTDRVHALPPYAQKGQRTRRNDRDGIFRRGGDRLLLDLTEDGEGYAATFDIGLELS
jgi:protocatechuate 3,4-dioxygenase beta subunit